MVGISRKRSLTIHGHCIIMFISINGQMKVTLMLTRHTQKIRKKRKTNPKNPTKTPTMAIAETMTMKESKKATIVRLLLCQRQLEYRKFPRSVVLRTQKIRPPTGLEPRAIKSSLFFMPGVGIYPCRACFSYFQGLYSFLHPRLILLHFADRMVNVLLYSKFK